jgi:SAM-dependent methyltransferase
MKQFWDERYSTLEYVYGKEPNEFFREQLQIQPPGKLLLPGEGEGRNAVYAATWGWNVSAYDTSTEGRKKALALAKEYGVKIEYSPGSYADAELHQQQYDMVGLFFTHMPSEMRIPFHKMIAGLLKPSGTIVLECFHKDQVHRDTGGPGNPDFLFSEEELSADFASLNILHLEKRVRDLQEGLFHQGEAVVIQMVAQKPATDAGR